MGAAEDRATDHAFVFSPTLKDAFRPHEWTHVAVTWDNPRGKLPGPDTVKIYVNGRVLPGTVGMPHVFGQDGQPFQNTPWWSVHSLQALFPGAKRAGWAKNTVRIGGELSKFFDLPGDAGLFPANFTADATFDEFYLWLDRGAWYGGGLWGLQQHWNRGRYYRPNDADPEDARFTSGPIATGPAETRVPVRKRLLGLSWTELSDDGATAADLGVDIDGAWHGPYRNPVFSPAQVRIGETLRYTAKLKASGAKVLVTTPVLDDVTLFFDCGGPKFLGWISL